MFDDDATEFDPNPWGARQRLIPGASFRRAPAPRESFFGTPVALATPSFAPPIAVATAPRLHIRLPTLRAMPAQPHRLGRYAMLFGFAAVLCLALAYALKPATVAPLEAASLVGAPMAPEPLATAVSGVVAETVPPPLVVNDPVVAKVTKPRVAPRPRAFAKRKPIRIDASITSSPLGQLRPSRR